MENSFGVGFVPDRRARDLFSYFLQDEIALAEDRWYLTLGSKFEHNDFTAFEFQPTASLLFTPSKRLSAWASVSRAVRTPSRADDDLRVNAGPIFIPFPAAIGIYGRPDVESEDLLAFQVGVRQQPTDEFFWDATAFYNHYADLIGLNPGAPIFGGPVAILPMYFANNHDAESYGFELASTYQVRPNWRLTGSYSLIRINAEAGADSFAIEGAAPRNMFSVLSMYDLGFGWQCDAAVRYVDVLPSKSVASYLLADVRLAYRPVDRLEIAVVGRNLFDSSHPEWVDVAATATEVQHEVYGVMTYRY
jgi:iron complex outermembrane receptor protein